jgi:hypothetical protein
MQLIKFRVSKVLNYQTLKKCFHIRIKRQKYLLIYIFFLVNFVFHCQSIINFY